MIREEVRQGESMQVIHISNDYYNSGVYATLHQGFLKNGMDSVFFVPMRYDEEKRETPHVIEADCFHKFDRFFYMNKQRKIYRRLRETLQQSKPDILHGYFWFSGGIHCLWAKREFGIPYVITVQNTDVNFIYKKMIHLRPLGWEILRQAERICFVSEAYRDAVLEHMIPEKDREQIREKSRLMAFALNPFWTENANTSAHCAHEGPIRLVTVGVVNKSKNQCGAARAVQLLRNKGLDIELTVIGACEDPIVDKELSTYDHVRRISKIPKEKLIDEYRRADLFLLASFAESFGLVYAEALSQGIPVLYSAGQGFDRQFPEGYVGYRVDPGNPEDIANTVERALKDYPNLQKNCKDAAARFSQSKICEQSEMLYRECLNLRM